ncbi:hypothetical protein IWW48_005744 [Coemansia sp. RSA 1200]|nr:hypothetical protein IWW48_005744 [Coemansia sp. RSA 1200]
MCNGIRITKDQRSLVESFLKDRDTNDATDDSGKFMTVVFINSKFYASDMSCDSVNALRNEGLDILIERYGRLVNIIAAADRIIASNTSILGSTAHYLYLRNHNPAVRATFACAQIKQAITQDARVLRTPCTETWYLISGEQPNSGPPFQYPAGHNLLAVFSVFGGYNIEDSYIISESCEWPFSLGKAYVDLFRNGNDRNISNLRNVAKELLVGRDGALRRLVESKKLDYCARAVIVPDPKLPIDSISLPLNIDLEHGSALLNRQPTLTRKSLAMVKLLPGTTSCIHINPLLCKQFNADFDGDEMNVYAINEKCRDEVCDLLPVIPTPVQDYVLADVKGVSVRDLVKESVTADEKGIRVMVECGSKGKLVNIQHFHISNYTSKGYVPTGIVLRWDGDNSRKRMYPKPMWASATIETCRQYIDCYDNGLMLLTGESSDIVVIDCDKQKPDDIAAGIYDGIAIFSSKLPAVNNIPKQKTASGGVHYFFSLSKSIRNGLTSMRNQSKLVIDGKPTTVDVRGDGGCIIVEPSKVGSKEYKFEIPLPTRADLPPMPAWCIKILNDNGKSVIRTSNSVSSIAKRLECMHIVEDGDSVYNMVKGDIETKLRVRIDRYWIRSGGFDFKPSALVECTLCGRTHSSNNYKARCIVQDVVYIKNYSSMCKGVALRYGSNSLIKDILYNTYSDRPYALLMDSAFRSNGHPVIHSNDNFYYFTGVIWKQLSKMQMNTLGMNACINVLTKLSIYGDDIASHMAKGVTHMSKARSIKSALDYYKFIYSDDDIEFDRDNANMLAARNGVINLTTGSLEHGTPSDYISMGVDIEYMGLDYPTPAMDEFIDDLFNGDSDMVAFVQTMLGYGITGSTKEQIWAMFTGRGSNGKSVLVSLIQHVLGPLHGTAPREIFFSSSRKAAEGAHNTHLLTIKNKRICTRAESDPTDKLNVEVLKMITGGDSIVARSAFASQYDTFAPTCLPILMCNHKPEVDITDPAMLRRIVVVPFNNVYVSAEDYDRRNPNHRIRNPDIKTKLLTAEKEILVWLVKGAVSWYRNKELVHPDAVKSAAREYVNENDFIQQFIDGACIVGKDMTIGVAEFLASINVNVSPPIRKKTLMDIMNQKGYLVNNVLVNGIPKPVFSGLSIVA